MDRVEVGTIEVEGAAEFGDAQSTVGGGHLGPVAHESALAPSLRWCGEGDEIAAGAVGAEQLRGEIDGQHSVVEAFAVVGEFGVKVVESGLQWADQPW